MQISVIIMLDTQIGYTVQVCFCGKHLKFGIVSYEEYVLFATKTM
jgi:hypothetical protein